MGFYRDLDPAQPTDASLIAQGDDELRAIKQALWDQWPNFVSGPANPTLTELNRLVGVTSGVQSQLDDINDRIILQSLPLQARNFQDPWWATSGAENQQRLFVGYAQHQDFTNVPWPWGSNAVSKGINLEYLTVFVTRYVNNGQNVAFNRAMRIRAGTAGDGSDSFVQEFYRGATDSSRILAAPWQRSTIAYVTATVEAQSGDVTGTTAKSELESIGCTPCP